MGVRGLTLRNNEDGTAQKAGSAISTFGSIIFKALMISADPAICSSSETWRYFGLVRFFKSSTKLLQRSAKGLLEDMVAEVAGAPDKRSPRMETDIAQTFSASIPSREDWYETPRKVYSEAKLGKHEKTHENCVADSPSRFLHNPISRVSRHLHEGVDLILSASHSGITLTSTLYNHGGICGNSEVL